MTIVAWVLAVWVGAWPAVAWVLVAAARRADRRLRAMRDWAAAVDETEQARVQWAVSVEGRLAALERQRAERITEPSVN